MNKFNSSFIGNNSPNLNCKTPVTNNDLRKSLSPDFIPFGSSSPLNNNSPFIRNRGGQASNWYKRGAMRFVDRNSDFKSASSSPSSQNSSMFSPYSNKSSPYNKGFNRQRGFYNNRNRKRNLDFNDISLYFNTSMLEDPWAELEKHLNTIETKNNENEGTKTMFTIDKASKSESTKVNTTDFIPFNNSDNEKQDSSSSSSDDYVDYKDGDD